MLDEALIIDVNGDLLPDLFGVDSISGQKATWVSLSGMKKNYREFRLELHGSDTLPSAFPLTNAFVDLTGDFHSDLIMPVIDANQSVLQVWQGKTGLFKSKSDMIQIELLPEFRKFKLGQASFGDMDADGKIDIILPVSSAPVGLMAIYLYSKGSWSIMLTTDASQPTLRFPDADFQQSDLLNFPPVIRIGDYNMDGYPDGVAVFEGKGNRRIPYLLENIPCKDRQSETLCTGARSLAIKTAIHFKENAALIVMFDIYENGILDFLVVTSSQKAFAIKAYRNDFNTDTTFLKILVLSGRCYRNCICKKIETPYGANQVGAVALYKTTSPGGKAQVCAAVQLSKSSHFSLQLPYTIFGLGRSPNFVDKVQVGIPQGAGQVDRIHSWQSLIPNSQVIVIPFPPDKPAEWMTKLLVTPSKLLLQTGGVLIGTCVFVAGLILMLYIKEKREDEKEKRQEAHKFHFDAL